MNKIIVFWKGLNKDYKKMKEKNGESHLKNSSWLCPIGDATLSQTDETSD